MFATWFQVATRTSPAVTAWAAKRQRRSIATWVANPTASPSGSTVVISVAVCVSSIERR